MKIKTWYTIFMMHHESLSSTHTEHEAFEQPEEALGATEPTYPEEISAETVEPETLGKYYDHCVGMGEDQQVMNFKSEEEFFRETGLRLSDIERNA